MCNRPAQGWGFIESNGQDVFLYKSDLKGICVDKGVNVQFTMKQQLGPITLCPVMFMGKHNTAQMEITQELSQVSGSRWLKARWFKALELRTEKGTQAENVIVIISPDEASYFGEIKSFNPMKGHPGGSCMLPLTGSTLDAA